MGATTRNLPFILYPKQEVAVTAMRDAVEQGHDVVIDKSRKAGATFLVCGVGTTYWLLTGGFQMLWGSRVESLVDTSSSLQNGMVIGDEKSLFYKLLYLLNTLPVWMRPRFVKNHLLLQNLDNGSAHAGSTTNLGFGKGSRAAVIMVDEFAAIEPKLAAMIQENIADVGACCIFNSTQGEWAGAHPYDKILSGGGAVKIILDWTDDPKKSMGLYRSPAPGFVTILDSAYYKAKYPGRFEYMKDGDTISVDSVPNTYDFVADGGVKFFHSPRSVWFDADEKRPGRTFKGICQNVLRIPAGSSDSFFSWVLMDSMRKEVSEPTYVGNVEFSINSANRIENPRFALGGKNATLSWWGALKDGRPRQDHNYAIGCDISRGTGSSNSVAAIIDANTNAMVGILATPYLRIEKFAELSVALASWVGGVEPPLLVWEENGASEYLARVEELGYVYLWTKESARNFKQRYGWRSTAGPNGTKVAILNALEAALSEGLKETPQFDPLRVPDARVVDEMESYVFFEGRVDVGPVTMQTDSSGAKAGHGDRVIALALAWLASRRVAPGTQEETKVIPEGSFQQRFEARKQREADEAIDQRLWYF